MLPKRFYKYLGTRVKSMQLGFATYYRWDAEKEHLILARPWQIMCMWFGFFIAGLGFVSIHVIQIYLKTHVKEIPEEGQAEESVTPDLKGFATTMIAGGEILLVTCMSFLNLVFLLRVHTFMYLLNELLDYNKKLTELIDEGKLAITDEQKKLIRNTEWLIILVILVSFMLPFGVALCLTADIEPTHQIIREWLDIEPSLSSDFAPILVILSMGTYGVGSTANLMILAITLYFMTATICTEAFTPEEMEWTPNVGLGRCNLVTSGFGKISDAETIHLYRTQQIINGVLNAFFRSVLISFHHVGLLAAFVVLLVFMIKFRSVLDEYGLIAYAIVFSCMMCPVTLVFFQSKMGGTVVDISEEFRYAGDRFIPNRFYFRKFCKSCTTFYIDVAYPFYHIHKETFTMFCEQAQEYSMELLLW